MVEKVVFCLHERQPEGLWLDLIMLNKKKNTCKTVSLVVICYELDVDIHKKSIYLTLENADYILTYILQYNLKVSSFSDLS